ncbi:MAG: type II toxin-antitoxin system RelE/ParE family toxin [Acetobacteraceae bacterium]
MAHSVVFAPEAEADLLELYEYIARHGGPERARRYAERIVATCRGLATFPERGMRCDDIRPGLRLTSYARRVTIAFHVAGERVVTIDRILYAGRTLGAPGEGP